MCGFLDMDPRGVWAPKKAKKSWDAKQSQSAPVLTGLKGGIFRGKSPLGGKREFSSTQH